MVTVSDETQLYGEVVCLCLLDLGDVETRLTMCQVPLGVPGYSLSYWGDQCHWGCA